MAPVFELFPVVLIPRPVLTGQGISSGTTDLRRQSFPRLGIEEMREVGIGRDVDSISRL
jgi:hypothetical protein